LKLKDNVQNGLMLWSITFSEIWPTLLGVLGYQTFVAAANIHYSSNRFAASTALFIGLWLLANPIHLLLSARVPECQTLKMYLDLDGIEYFQM